MLKFNVPLFAVFVHSKVMMLEKLFCSPIMIELRINA